MAISLPGTRFLILVVATLCLTSIHANMSTYNFTKICIADDTNAVNQTFTKTEKSFLQASTAIGVLGASLPYAYLFAKFSHRWTFASAGLITAVATASIPFANQAGFGYFLVARIFQGVAFAASFPIIGSITVEWATLREHGLFIAFLTGSIQLSNMFTMPVSGALCSSKFGWPSVYYLHSALTAIFFLLWIVIHRTKPSEHPIISGKEVAMLQEGKVYEKKGDVVPYGAILKSKTCWGIWFAAFGDLLTAQMIAMFNPQYMKEFLDYNLLNTGFLAAVPVAAQFGWKMFAGVTSDRMTCLSETAKLRLFNSIALAGTGVFFVFLSFIPPSQPLLAVLVMIFSESLIGFHTSGFNKCATLHARQHVHFVLNQVTNLWAVAILVTPFIVAGLLEDENTAHGWRNVFLVHAAVMIFTNFVFCFWADAKAAKWTNQERLQTEQ